jgi:hypothetical protein
MYSVHDNIYAIVLGNFFSKYADFNKLASPPYFSVAIGLGSISVNSLFSPAMPQINP